MSSIQTIHSFEQLKLLADPRRLAIIRQLMVAPSSLTMLGKSLGEHPAWIRHHLKILESAGLVEFSETRIQLGIIEKFYRPCANGFIIQELILPAETPQPMVVISGSHDPALELLGDLLSENLNIQILPVGSLDGLVALRQNLCNLSGTHLLDLDGEYNLPYIRHFFPDRDMEVVTLAHREQGLMTTPGNPSGIHLLTDLARHDINFINRNPGSGTRLWLDNHLHLEGIPIQRIRGYQNIVMTHTDCARAIQSGKADVALGLKASAHQFGLDFIPLFQERFDIVFSRDQKNILSPILETLQTAAFRQSMESLSGYDTLHTGEQIIL